MVFTAFLILRVQEHWKKKWNSSEKKNKKTDSLEPHETLTKREQKFALQLGKILKGKPHISSKNTIMAFY